jgi:carboxypeptidase Q
MRALPSGVLLLATCLAAASPGAAQGAAPPSGPTQTQGSPSISENALELLDRIGGRMSGQPSGDRAERFVAGRLRAYGLEAVELEPFPLLGWSRGGAEMTLADGPTAGRRVPVLSLGHVGTHDVSAPLLDGGFGTAEEIEEAAGRVRGAILVVRVGEPAGYGRSVHRTEKISLAAAAGAAGFVMVAPRPGTLVQVGTASLGDEPSPLPAVGIGHEAGSWLLRMMAHHPGQAARLRVDNWLGPAQAANVWGGIGGRLDEVVLAGAHLDSWDLGSGALDNGSGTLVLLEAARLLAERVRGSGERPLRSIRFAFWMGEELGLYGSRHHVARLLEEGTLSRYRVLLNLDMVGTPTGFGAMDRPELAPLLEALAAEITAAGIPLRREIPLGGGLYSDHQPFLLQGVPVVSLRSRYREGAVGYYHSAGDTRDKLDEPGLQQAAMVAAELLWRLANATELPDRWDEAEIGRRLDAMGLRDPLERGGEWRW